MGFHVLRHDCSQISVLSMRDYGTQLHRESQNWTKPNLEEQYLEVYTLQRWVLSGRDTRILPKPSQSLHLFPSPPLFAMLTSFQFTQSPLPTRLAALFPCDCCWPIAAQAHLVPCETWASLHYITAATGCHGNAHGHCHTVLVCVWTMAVCFSVLNVYRHRVPTGLENHWKLVDFKKKRT